MLIGDEEEELILLDGPSEGAPGIGVLLERFLTNPGDRSPDLIDEVDRLSSIVPEVAVGAPMKLVAATLSDDVDGAAHRKSILRGEAVPVHLILLDSIRGDRGDPVLPRTVLILAAVNRREVIAPVAAPDREPCREEPGEP